MRDFVKNKIRERLLNESIEAHRINDIDDDNRYDSLIGQAEELSKGGEIGFGSAEPFGVLYDTETGELAGATWLETGGTFSPHIVIKPEYRGRGYSNLLIADLVKKFEEMKRYMGPDYKFIVHVVNDKAAHNLLKNYGFKVIDTDAQGVTLSK